VRVFVRACVRACVACVRSMKETQILVLKIFGSYVCTMIYIAIVFLLQATSTLSSKRLMYKKGEKDKLFAQHVTPVCKVHNQAIVSFLQEVQGGARPTTERSRDNIGHNVHV